MKRFIELVTFPLWVLPKVAIAALIAVISLGRKEKHDNSNMR